MIRRRDLEPALSLEADLTPDAILLHLRQWQADTIATVERLEKAKPVLAEGAGKLENPQAAQQLAEYFVDFFLGFAADLDRLIEGLASGPRLDQVIAIKQLTAAAADQEKRVVVFRDKWVNKPLPYEDMRPILDGMSAAARDQLLDYRNLQIAGLCIRALATAAGADAAAPSPPAGDPAASDLRKYDRRALFTRFLGRKEP